MALRFAPRAAGADFPFAAGFRAVDVAFVRVRDAARLPFAVRRAGFAEAAPALLPALLTDAACFPGREAAGFAAAAGVSTPRS